MRKTFNIILGILSVLLLGLIGFMELNSKFNWADTSSKLFSYAYFYGVYVLVALFGINNLFGKGVIRIIFFILLILVIALYVVVTFFPQVIDKIAP